MLLLVILAAITLFSCKNKYIYPRPSSDFYVNDFANALLPGSRQSFLDEGERLYESTKDEELGAAQFVVATLLVENESELGLIDKTEIFREWQIGGNDMGLLLLLVFKEVNEEKILISTQIEIGYRMEAYITSAEAGNLIDSCLYNPEWEGSIDLGIGELYYELIGKIYVKAYGYETFVYDMDVYRDFLITAEDMAPQDSMGLLEFVFSPHSSVWAKIIVILIFLLLGSGLGGGTFALVRKGAGGSSGGYGVKH